MSIGPQALYVYILIGLLQAYNTNYRGPLGLYSDIYQHILLGVAPSQGA